MVLFDWLIVMMSLTVVVHQVNTALVPAKDLLQQEENVSYLLNFIYIYFMVSDFLLLH